MLIADRTFTIGADPEIFMGVNGQFVSAHGAVPGDKGEPYPVPHGAVQVDGMALEFNIDPAENFEVFNNNLESVKWHLKDMIGDKEFLKTSSVTYDKDFLKDIPARNRILGCSSDFNAWSLDENPSPKSSNLMRTAGGHIHIGGFHTNNPYGIDHFKLCARLCRILDETLGIYSLFWDDNDERRTMYGRAGSFRPKTYGVEYRTLSNMWIFEPELVKFVYDSVREALVKTFTSDYEPPAIVEDILNNSDRNSNYFEERSAVNAC